MPHEVVGDQLPAPLECLEQRDRTVQPGERRGRVDLDHGQPPPHRSDLVSLPGVRLLPHPQGRHVRLEYGPSGHGR